MPFGQYLLVAIERKAFEVNAIGLKAIPAGKDRPKAVMKRHRPAGATPLRRARRAYESQWECFR